MFEAASLQAELGAYVVALEVGGVHLAEQAMAAVLFGTGTLGDIGPIAALGLHFVQMCIQHHGDKCGCCTAVGRL